MQGDVLLFLARLEQYSEGKPRQAGFYLVGGSSGWTTRMWVTPNSKEWKRFAEHTPENENSYVTGSDKSRRFTPREMRRGRLGTGQSWTWGA